MGREGTAFCRGVLYALQAHRLRVPQGEPLDYRLVATRSDLGHIVATDTVSTSIMTPRTICPNEPVLIVNLRCLLRPEMAAPFAFSRRASRA